MADHSVLRVSTLGKSNPHHPARLLDGAARALGRSEVIASGAGGRCAVQSEERVPVD